MRILCNAVFLKKNPSQHYCILKGAELQSIGVCSYKSSCSGNLRWCCHLSQNLEKYPLARGNCTVPRGFGCFGKKAL